MKFCTQINTNSAVKFAMKLLLSSKKSVYMTMDMQGEIDRPLPKEYHNLIAQLAIHNVSIHRYMFGEKKLFNKMRGKFDGVQAHYGGKMNKYQRMLIIDERVGMFGVNGNVFFTKFKPLINSLLSYVLV